MTSAESCRFINATRMKLDMFAMSGPCCYSVMTCICYDGCTDFLRWRFNVNAYPRHNVRIQIKPSLRKELDLSRGLGIVLLVCTRTCNQYLQIETRDCVKCHVDVLNYRIVYDRSSVPNAVGTKY